MPTLGPSIIAVSFEAFISVPYPYHWMETLMNFVSAASPLPNG
jgi:hypothetical protein